ncbi:unnamed protein product [Effrenium voratum]|nr:unnamed protein product [Effrenium voratum]|eukprot:CAMPEP_0181411458 /NCGR_PEP_ID=MMETSP1110-20121109/7888_1 /TAXON_ID=174948 /ORGANISM="Symbiodinium sp., Strain CCMP421" /LENGTH=605 /DNA_ID=CAMNT_0023534083 /DNA_START=36 /DNA_END=1853 /DNA_ORIENTATION=+
MKFGKSIGSQQEGHADLHYLDYKLLKKKIKDVVARLQSSELAEALTANSEFEEVLAAEIGRVNQCFSVRQRELLDRTAGMSEELQKPQQERVKGAAGGSAVAPRDALRHLVDILQEVDQLRKYAVWNAVGLVKILKKRRKQTSFGIEDSAAERVGWLSRQNFFSGSDFAELHASIESLGQMLVISEIVPEGALHSSKEAQAQCPICLDTISDMVELSCQHRFCWKCFVLGPIAFQPGEYRITQCPICRKETREEQEGALSPAAAQGPACSDRMQPSQEGVLTRFLHTYFGGKGADAQGGDVDKARIQGMELEEEDVGELVKVLLADCSTWPSSADAAASGDFFDTLPSQAFQDKPLQAAQKLQWLQLAFTGDPFALDDNMYCSLCSEPLMMEAVVTTPCKHHFHRVCINRVDTPECPLCSKALPFSWFLPNDHPCAEHGFRTVTPRSYQPYFAGGPSKGSCGYPLQHPPPAQLYSATGTMRSFLHRLIPTGSGVAEEDDEEEPASPQAPVEELREDESSSDSNSEEEEEEELCEAPLRFRRGTRPPPVYACSAVGRIKLLDRRRWDGQVARNWHGKSGQQQAAERADDRGNPKVELFTALFGDHT